MLINLTESIRQILDKGSFGCGIFVDLQKASNTDLKNKESADSFKTAIKRWKPESCPCRLCKTYLQNIGYL